MTGLILLGVLVAFVAWRIRRRRTKMMMAGLTGERPTFTVSPPTRRMSPLKREQL